MTNLEKQSSDAPVWYSADEASAWASGYNSAIENTRAATSSPGELGEVVGKLRKAADKHVETLTYTDGRVVDHCYWPGPIMREAADTIVRLAASAQAQPNRERIAETVGWYLACVVSGNNQPDMSGDPRKRIPPGRRRHFDDACLACADAILALLHAPEAKGWQPIETAPKDGSFVLAYQPGRVLDTLAWDKDSEQWMNGYDDRPQHPTNWQPLPAPPSLTGEQGGAK